MDYKEMLKKARAGLPKNVETGDRIEIPDPRVEIMGRQTCIRNFIEIAKAMRRDPKHLAKFLFKELAAPGSIANNMLTLQGKIPRELIQKRVHDYIKDFVNCQACSKLDTNLTKDGRVWLMKCESCGAKRTIQ